MSKLERKADMSPLQLAVVIVMFGLGISGRTTVDVIKAGEHGAWLAVITGCIVFYGAAWLMIKLGRLFPRENFIEYLPRIWGKWPGLLLSWLFVLVFYFNSITILHGFSREIAFFMFDRTPFEVIEASLLAVAVYCAMQDWGTILRVTQYMFCTAFPSWLLLVLPTFLNFRFINILPLWPQNWAGVAEGIYRSWALFQGYESILLLLPLVYKKNTSVSRVVAGAFVLLGATWLMITMLVIGVFSLEEAKRIPYPILTAIRTVELPGTFIERLDTYFLLFWMQTVFVFLVLSLYTMAQALTCCYRFADHRPFVLALVPIVFLGGDALHNSSLYDQAHQLANITGLIFSFGVIPLSYGFTLWKRRGKDEQDTKSAC
jgi:spore germination protein